MCRKGQNKRTSGPDTGKIFKCSKLKASFSNYIFGYFHFCWKRIFVGNEPINFVGNEPINSFRNLDEEQLDENKFWDTLSSKEVSGYIRNYTQDFRSQKDKSVSTQMSAMWRGLLVIKKTNPGFKLLEK
jgi:hypothetical protein